MNHPVASVSVISSIRPQSEPFHHGPGQLETLLVRKVKVDGARILLEGIPATRGGHVRHAQINFLAHGPVPDPRMDIKADLIEMFYPESDRAEVLGLLRSGRERLCYFWKDGRGTRVRAWLMASA